MSSNLCEEQAREPSPWDDLDRTLIEPTIDNASRSSVPADGSFPLPRPAPAAPETTPAQPESTTHDSAGVRCHMAAPESAATWQRLCAAYTWQRPRPSPILAQRTLGFGLQAHLRIREGLIDGRRDRSTRRGRALCSCRGCLLPARRSLRRLKRISFPENCTWTRQVDSLLGMRIM